MTINYTPTPNDYLIDRFAFIVRMEEIGGIPSTEPYNDGKGWVTIGVGFNLSVKSVRDAVFASMGIVDATLIAKLTEYLAIQHQGLSNATIRAEIKDIMDLYGGGPLSVSLLLTKPKICSTVPMATMALHSPTRRVMKWSNEMGTEPN